jgi:hypothetical protein
MLHICRYNDAMMVLRNGGRGWIKATVASTVIGRTMESFYRQCLG